MEGGRRYQGTTKQICGLFPFASGSGAAPRGVPIGRHMYTAEPVGLDPSAWLDSLVSNTGMWIQGQPGIGKSTIVKRLALGYAAFGVTVVVPGDIKGEYSGTVRAIGGSVYRLGRGLDALNPLDRGPLRGALAGAVGEERETLLEETRARQIALLESLVIICRKAPLTITERVLLGAAFDLARDTAEHSDRDPVVPEVLEVLHQAPDELLRVAAVADRDTFHRDQRELINALRHLCSGPIRGLFDRASSVAVEEDTRAMSLDISALDNDDDDVVAAAMLCSWSWTAALIDASVGRGARRNVFQVQDELWRALRAAPGLVERSDRVTRLGRHRGVVSAQVTHSLDDLKALPTEEDRMKAKGMAGRNNTIVLGGMNANEVDVVQEIAPMSSQEANLVTSWAAPPTWVAKGQHPGRGRYLLKSANRIGLPVEMTLTSTEKQLYNTDTAWQGGA